jgi:phosphohistidine phosphatase SixA
LKTYLRITAAALVALTMTACGSLPNSANSLTGAQTASRALDALRNGGYVLILRHGASNPDQADTEPLNLANCKPQRTLTDAGRLAATNVGTIFASENVPIGQIYTSRYCRAIETAERIAEHTKTKSIVKTDDFSEGGQVVTPNENSRRAKAMRLAVAHAPAAGTNTLIVSHKPNVSDAFGQDYFAFGEAEMVIFKPSANLPDGYQMIARVKLKDWSDYVKSTKSL